MNANMVCAAVIAVFITSIGLTQTISVQESYPNRPITIIVAQSTGGANDTIARAFAQRVSTTLGQPVVIDNRAGAGVNVGTAAAARAPKDG